MSRDEKLFSFLNRNAFFLLAGMGLLHLLISWPGILTPDSQGQYQEALKGVYSDHHPPLMSFIWHSMDMLVKGPGLMLLLHLSLFYAGLFFAMKSVEQHAKRSLFLLYPLFPAVLIYTDYIWKDVGFAYAFVCVGGVLAWVSSREEPLSLKLALPLLAVLFYGSSVKYQAQFLAPVFLTWIVHLMAPQMRLRNLIIGAVLLITAFSLTLHKTNESLTPSSGKNHSWQYVKLYDLAALSLDLGRPLFPEFTKTEHFSLEALRAKYNPFRVDDLVFPEDAILRMGKTQQERDIVWQVWATQIASHLLLYLKHRFSNLAYVLLSTPGFDLYVNAIEKIAAKDSAFYKILYGVGRVLGYLLMAHLLTVLLCIAYIILALKTLRKSWAAKPLLAINLTGLMMVVMLLFLSMAGTPRYTYITLCMVHLSHFWAYLCVKVLKQAKSASSLALCDLNTAGLG